MITDMRDATFKETPMDRAERYAELKLEIESLVAGETYVPARYASAACLLAEAFRPRFFWTGFYVVDPARGDELVVGPYQGTLGCLRIPFGRGVCGAAAASGETQLVRDVHEFPGHIACDSRSNSEIVVPVRDRDGKLAAVLDIDSTEFDAFDEEDRAGLEAICGDLLTVK
jgi:L-methionine (R)-S-oxide reductase